MKPFEDTCQVEKSPPVFKGNFYLWDFSRVFYEFWLFSMDFRVLKKSRVFLWFVLGFSKVFWVFAGVLPKDPVAALRAPRSWMINVTKVCKAVIGSFGVFFCFCFTKSFPFGCTSGLWVFQAHSETRPIHLFFTIVFHIFFKQTKNQWQNGIIISQDLQELKPGAQLLGQDPLQFQQLELLFIFSHHNLWLTKVANTSMPDPKQTSIRKPIQ